MRQLELCVTVAAEQQTKICFVYWKVLFVGGAGYVPAGCPAEAALPVDILSPILSTGPSEPAFACSSG